MEDYNKENKIKNSEEIIEKRKKQLKENLTKFLNNRSNLIFIGIFILAFFIRLYYFFITSDQPLWYDESDYLAYAKNLAGFNVDWVLSDLHSSIFPYLVAFLFKIGLSEISTKFLLEFIPSLLLIYLVYKVCLLIYNDKRIALISSFLMAFFWNILFNSFRFHVGIPAMVLAFLAIYVFWQGYENKQKIFGKINYKWAIPLTIFLVVFSYGIRRGYFLFGFFFLFYMLFTRKFTDLIKDKYNWIALILGIILLWLLDKFIFVSSIVTSSSTYSHFENPISFVYFQIFGVFFKNLNNSGIDILFYLFYIGFAIIIFNLIISFGHFKKSKNREIKGDFFAFLMVIITLSYFMFYQRDLSIGDPRWFFPLLLGAFIFISRATIFIADNAKKLHKLIPIILILLLIGYGGYYQFQHADLIIKTKVNSYNGIKQASFYLNENSEISSRIVSIPLPQTAYYSERSVVWLAEFLNKSHNTETTLEEFLEEISKIENKDIKYIIVTFSEPGHPEWMRKEVYSANSQLIKWEIPFMNTSIDFINNQQDIKQEVIYGNISFKLLTIKEDSFVYEIIRN
jgi:hypothetical protein